MPALYWKAVFMRAHKPGQLRHAACWLAAAQAKVEADIDHVQIFDALSMSPQPLATIQLPQRVPAGFHGTYLTQLQVDAQSSAA